MIRGGYSGPLASPPAMMTGAREISMPLRCMNPEDATMTAAPPSARRAHSSKLVTGATASTKAPIKQSQQIASHHSNLITLALSTSFSDSGFFVSAEGCRTA